MPLRVVHPVRVVVDATMLDPARTDTLADAVEAGLARAARASRTRVLSGLPAGTRVALGAPQVSWAPGAAAQLDAGRRAEIEALVAAAIARAMDAAGVVEGELRSEVQRAEKVGEAVDESRFSAPLRRYVVPSYRGGSEALAVVERPADEPELEPVAVWAAVTGENYAARFWQALSEREHLWPAAGLLGALFVRADGDYGVGAVRFPEQQVLADFFFDRRQLPRFEDRVGGGRPLRLDPAQVHRLQWWGAGSEAGAVIPDHYRAGFLVRARERHPRLPGQDQLDYELSISSLVDDALRARIAAASAASVTSFLLLTAPGQRSLIQLSGHPDWVRPGLDLALLPLSDRVAPADRPGAVDVPAAEAAVTDQPAAPSWPVPLGDTLQACEPFLDEPELTALAAGAELPARLRDLAQRLQVPECRYAGRFVLSCAAALSGLARAAGLRAVGSADTTDVSLRRDGGGNSGYVHVRPPESPQLAALRFLTGFGAELADFARAVIGTYNLAPNRTLLPSAASWELRFRDALTDALGDAFAVVFSEACRILLLAQLRSSARGIDGRRRAFPAALEAFNQALDALGPRIVQLGVLRRALVHSRDMGRTGTVRDVLSTTRARPVPFSLVADDGEDDDAPIPPQLDFEGGIAVSAPLADYPAAVLAVVGDLRVGGPRNRRTVDFRRRTWTVEDIDRELNNRRAALNETDPLFLQIGDLHDVFTGADDDHERARAYLTTLLEEMATANAAMRTKAEDPADGGFFAVEASQYVWREGGRDRRGLAFELRGLHALADEQLRPRAGGERLYGEGVNRALGRKAGRDELVGIGATAGVIVLGLLCAPLGAVAAGAITGLAGVALAAHDVAEAARLKEIYRSLESDPEALLHWQDVQLAQLSAALSVAFSVFDVLAAGAAARELVAAAKLAPAAAERAGLKGAALEAFQATRRTVLKNLSEGVLELAVRQAVGATAVVAVLDRLFPLVFTPVILPWLEEQARGHGTLTPADQAELTAILVELREARR